MYHALCRDYLNASGCGDAKATGTLMKIKTTAEIDANSSLNSHLSGEQQDQTDEEIEMGHKLGALIAEKLTERLQELGMPAVRATGSGLPEQLNDLVIRGGFVGIEEGNMALRVTIGFGAGSNKLQTHFDVYQITPAGRTLMGSAGITAAGGKMPGILLSMGIGGVAKGLMVGGTIAAGKEFTSESIEGAALRTAEEFITTVKPGLIERGWIEDD